MARLEGKTVAVVGLGKSGIAAARLCLRHGASVVGMDEAQEPNASAEAIAGDGVELIYGGLDAERLGACDMVVVSPGLPPREALDRAEAAGVEVIGELDLASRFIEAPIVLIGGTNGKSTVTALVGAMAEASGRRTFVGGNFGTPLAEAALSVPYDVHVVEISSFQAERVPTLRAKVHALLNVSEDHLDRYDGFPDYANAKGNPFAQMTAEDFAVIPAGDATCAGQAARGQARVVTFSRHHHSDAAQRADVEPDASGKHVVDHLRGLSFPRELSPLTGEHNVANIAAAIAVAFALELPEQAVRGGLERFAGLPHRAVRVGERGGTRFYDDSKATNVGAAVAALRGLAEPKAVLIAGGRDKQGDYGPLVQALAERGRALVLIGEAADRIADAAEGELPIHRAQTMDDAVKRAAELAEPGDAVLLSPACSSFDMFGSYAERGDAFVAAVEALTPDSGGQRR
jgi:UDP-N-acetylmuramoylalanine--D-glutamate ligase